MEFASTGKHCDMESCHQLDWLPFDCQYCHHSYCLQHRTPELHECKEYQEHLAKVIAARQAEAELLAGSTTAPSYRCHRKGCKKREIVINQCRQCQQHYCLSHRFPNQHVCKAIPKTTIHDHLYPTSSNRSTEAASTIPMLKAGLSLEELRKLSSSTSTNGNTNISTVSRLMRSS